MGRADKGNLGETTKYSSSETEKISGNQNSLSTEDSPEKVRKLGQYLVKIGLIEQKLLDDFFGERTPENFSSLLDQLLDLEMIKEREVAESFAREYRLPLLEPDKFSISPEALALIPEEIAVKYDCIPLQLENKTLLLAVYNPISSYAKDQVHF